MNTSFQISKFPRMVPQLSHPLLLLILQLLLHLPQHFVNILHHRTSPSSHSHFHTPPALHGVKLVSCLHLAYSTHNRIGWPLLGNRPSMFGKNNFFFKAFGLFMSMDKVVGRDF